MSIRETGSKVCDYLALAIVLLCFLTNLLSLFPLQQALWFRDLFFSTYTVQLVPLALVLALWVLSILLRSGFDRKRYSFLFLLTSSFLFCGLNATYYFGAQELNQDFFINNESLSSSASKIKTADSDKDESSVTLLEHNVHQYRDNCDDVEQMIRTTSANVVALVEVSLPCNFSLKSSNAIQTRFPFQADNGIGRKMVFSQWPVSNSRTFHVQSFTSHNYNFFEAIVQHPKRPIRLVLAHPPHPTSRSGYFRRVLILRQLKKAFRDNPLQLASILVGDLNGSSQAPTIHQLRTDLQLQDPRYHLAFKGTYHSSWPWFFRLPIDHVLPDKHFSVVHVATLEPTRSDHLPYQVKLAVL